MVRFPLEYNQILNSSKYNTFGWVRKHADGTPRFHKGWDLVAPKGTLVLPVAPGKVFSVEKTDKGKYGKFINFQFDLNGKKRYAFYAHLSEVFVNAGDVIESTSTYMGAVGDTGNAKGIAADKVHLHFEFRTDAYGGSGSEDRIDPELILGSPPYHGLYYFEDEPI